MLEPSKPIGYREWAYAQLRESILNGSITPGARISEPGLAEQLGISRTPVREALQRLSQEGLVELSPNKGARVRALSLQEIREVYEVRALLEAEAARLAAQNATEKELKELDQRLKTLDKLPRGDYLEQMQVDFDFHTALVEASHNRMLARVYQDLRASLALVRASMQTHSQHPTTRKQHKQIMQALHKHNAEAAAKAARTHVLYFRDLVTKSLDGLNKE